MIKSAFSFRATGFRKLTSSGLMAAVSALTILSVVSVMVHAQSPGVPEAGAQVTPGDRIDQLFSGSNPAPPAAQNNTTASPGQTSRPATNGPAAGARSAQSEVPLGPGGGQVAPVTPSPSPVPVTTPPWGASQAVPVRPALVPGSVQAVGPGQVSPAVPGALGGAAPATAARPLTQPAPTAPDVEVQPSNEINLTEEDAVRQIETLNRQRRVLETQRHVEAERLAIFRTIQDLRKVMNESRAVASPVPGFQEPVAPPPPVSSAAAGQIPVGALERSPETTDPISQMAVLSIAGPVERLVATVRVQGFGNMQVRTGSTLPGNVRVVSVEGRGITVRSVTGGARLLPFAN